MLDYSSESDTQDFLIPAGLFYPSPSLTTSHCGSPGLEMIPLRRPSSVAPSGDWTVMHQPLLVPYAPATQSSNLFSTNWNAPGFPTSAWSGPTSNLVDIALSPALSHESQSTRAFEAAGEAHAFANLPEADLDPLVGSSWSSPVAYANASQAAAGLDYSCQYSSALEVVESPTLFTCAVEPPGFLESNGEGTSHGQHAMVCRAIQPSLAQAEHAAPLGSSVHEPNPAWSTHLAGSSSSVNDVTIPRSGGPQQGTAPDFHTSYNLARNAQDLDSTDVVLENSHVTSGSGFAMFPAPVGFDNFVRYEDEQPRLGQGQHERKTYVAILPNDMLSLQPAAMIGPQYPEKEPPALTGTVESPGGVQEGPFELEEDEEAPPVKRTGRSKTDEIRTHPYYFLPRRADGLFHCPYETATGLCQKNHEPTKGKCDYDKYIDSHEKPWICNIGNCSTKQFSSNACKLRHERETHLMHGHVPSHCLSPSCGRHIDNRAFGRGFNLADHVRRTHPDLVNTDWYKTLVRNTDRARRARKRNVRSKGTSSIKKSAVEREDTQSSFPLVSTMASAAQANTNQHVQESPSQRTYSVTPMFNQAASDFDPGCSAAAFQTTGAPYFDSSRQQAVDMPWDTPFNFTAEQLRFLTIQQPATDADVDTLGWITGSYTFLPQSSQFPTS